VVALMRQDLMFGHQHKAPSIVKTRGDDLLQSVATLLKTTFRDCDVIGRIGGDEFVILLNRIANRPG